MKIVVTPAKNIRQEVDFFQSESTPVFIDRTQYLLENIKTLNVQQLQKVLRCSEKIAIDAYWQFQNMDLHKNQVPALFAYQGIQFDHLAAHLFTDEEYTYMRNHIVILSGFYGILEPFDGIVPYRLELNDPLSVGRYRHLYDYWGRDIYDHLIKDDTCILDLGAKQYSIMIQRYLDDGIRYVKCHFKENKDGKLKEIGVYVKIARGEMIRYLIQNGVDDLEHVKEFQLLGYHFDENLSDQQHFVFVR